MFNESAICWNKYFFYLPYFLQQLKASFRLQAKWCACERLLLLKGETLRMESCSRRCKCIRFQNSIHSWHNWSLRGRCLRPRCLCLFPPFRTGSADLAGIHYCLGKHRHSPQDKCSLCLAVESSFGPVTRCIWWMWFFCLSSTPWLSRMFLLGWIGGSIHQLEWWLPARESWWRCSSCRVSVRLH